MELKLQLFEKRSRRFKVTNTSPIPSLQPESIDEYIGSFSFSHKILDNNNFFKL